MGSNVRVDKWLWAVRVFKTRSMASEACKKGQVIIDGIAVKPSRTIKENETIKVRKSGIYRTYRVKALVEKRMSAKLVEDYLADETSQEELDILENQKNSFFFSRPKGTGRPTKKDRRDIDRMFDE